jgi:hypothetical protein
MTKFLTDAALSEVEWAVPAAPESMKAGRGVCARTCSRLAVSRRSVPVRSKTRRGELGLVAEVLLYVNHV